MNSPKNIGAELKVVKGIPPNDVAAGTVNGAAIDRDGFLSCVLEGQTGAASGTPTSLTADFRLEDSADGSTGWADLAGAVVPQLTAVDQDKHVDANLASAKRYIRTVATVAFVGGTSPKVGVAAAVALGPALTAPTSY